MEDKRSLGEYIAEHRRALGLTQRQFAERLYVTDSAVSKWERGLSYPDITLLHDICAVLGVTEHELLTASEDTEARRAVRWLGAICACCAAGSWGRLRSTVWLRWSASLPTPRRTGLWAGAG